MSDIALAINRFLAAMAASDTPSYVLDDLLQPCLAAEFALRRLFATDRGNFILGSLYIGLFDVFDLSPDTRISRPRDWNDRNSEFVWRHGDKTYRLPQKYILPIEPCRRRPQGSPSMVATLADFRAAWNAFSGGAFSAITDWENLMVAGGSVSACLTEPLYTSSSSPQDLFKVYQSAPYNNCDIDLFLWGMTEEQAKIKMEDIFVLVKSSALGGAVCFRTKNTITIQTEFPRRQIQIVMRLYKSPAEILCGFDVDCCCVGYNGTNVFINPRGLAAIVRQCNTIDLSRRSPSYEYRLSKYADRGYEIFYPALERSRLNYNWLAHPDRNLFPKGLGRLIVYEIMLADHEYFPRLYEGLGRRIGPTSDLSETLRPSNYEYGWCKIPYGPKWWDPRKVTEHIRILAHSIVVAISEKLQHGARTHFHVVTFGTMRKCLERCCDRCLFESRESQMEELPGALFRGPAQFMRDDPGRQLVGSFNPTNFGDWEAQAYVEDEDLEVEGGYDADTDEW